MIAPVTLPERPVKALLFEPIHSRGIEVLETVACVRVAERLDADYLLEAVHDADALVIRVKVGVDRRLMDAAPHLRVIGRHGVGVDNIDVGAATERRIYVVNTPEANAESVAEHAIGLMIMLFKELRHADHVARRGDWDSRSRLIGKELLGKTIGVVGFGRIGRRVAEIANKGLGMSVLYHDVVSYPDLERSLDAHKVTLDELLANSDVVSLHLPLVAATYHLIGERELVLMKPSAYVVNTSRGAVVDEVGLYHALKSGEIAGAGLDVFEEEPVSAENPLWELGNVVASPHTSALTEEAMMRMAMVTEDVVRVLRGEEPKHWVNRW